METKADVVFEVSFEVANKVGGIYAVLESKAARMVESYKDGYFAIGPYYPEKAVLETIRQNPPRFCERAINNLKHEGISCYFGKWMIEGRPNVILVDFSELLKNVNKIKWELWYNYKIDSLGTGFDFDEPVAWATACGMLIDNLLPHFKESKIVCHFHEWLSGATLLYLKDKVPTIFSTHATMLGRTIAGWGEDLYKEVNEALKNNTILDPKRSYKYGIQAKHFMEKACAENCNIFTTTSEITGREAKYILGKYPDIILPNGLDIDRYPTIEEYAFLHRKYLEKIKNFLNAYFNPYYETELWDAMIFLTSGRFEFSNKGYDVFIDALGKLNQKMIEENIKKNIFTFFFIPMWNSKEDIDLLQSIKIYDDMKDKLNDEMAWIQEMTMNALIKGKMPKMSEIFREEFRDDYKRKIAVFKKKGNPPLSAFVIEDKNNSIVEAFKKNNLLNRKEDKVKVILYPSYLSTTDRLLSLNYQEVVQGSHIGVFPSYYEPWGYTPLEVAANGVLAITSDLAGFGIFIKPHLKEEMGGIMVLKREGKTYEEIVNELYKMLLHIVKMPRKERIPKKVQAKDLASLADWKILIDNYIEAHNKALERFKK